MPKIRAAVAGANGYAGMTAVGLLAVHPHVELVQLTSRSLAGKPYQEVFPLLGRLGRFTEEVEPRGLDVIFSCLPHAAGAARTADWFRAGARVIDMSADYRLKDSAQYPRWYGQEHPAPELLNQAVLGLPELHADQIADAQLVAVPGCYSTASILALAPAVASGQVASDVVVDAKSGVSGAGKSLKPSSHAGFVLENLSPYAVGAHRHAPEIAQQLGMPVCFVPHLLPVRRGLLATCYVQTDADARALLEDAYAESPVVRVLPDGVTPELARVQTTDAAELAVFTDDATGTTIVICALDNLGKGAAGQAVQNANLALGLAETAGLRLHGVFV